MNVLTRTTLALALAAIALLAGACPTMAADRPPADVWVYATSDSPCYKTTNAYSGKEASFKPMLASLYRASSEQVNGVDAFNGSTQFRWVVVKPGRGCWQPSGWLSSPVPAEAIDVAGFDDIAIVAPPAEGIGVGAVLSLADRAVNAAPALDSTTLGEVEEGQVVSTRAGVVVQAQRGVLGRVGFRPVEFNGQLGWMLASSLTDVPELTVDELTTSITPQWEVTAWAQPGDGEQAATLPAGVPVPAGVSATAGYLPVDVEGRVAWTSQADLATQPTATASPTPTETLAERAARLKAEAAARLEEREKAKGAAQETVAEQPTSRFGAWWANAKAKVTGENPVAETAARARLYIAGWFALLALLLAGAAHAGTMWMRGKQGVLARVSAALFPAITAAAHAALPVAVLVAWWASVVAPRSYFNGTVLSAAVGGGLALAWVTAHRIATMRGAGVEAVMVVAREQQQFVGSAGVWVGAAVFLVFGGSLATAVVLGLVAAGAVAGWRTPKPGERDADIPHTEEVTASLVDRTDAS